jgi:hypothetical protein
LIDESIRVKRIHKAVLDEDKMYKLGVRDIPIYAYPVKDIPRLNRTEGYVPIEKITVPIVLR